jgi:hypothetical protein
MVDGRRVAESPAETVASLPDDLLPGWGRMASSDDMTPLDGGGRTVVHRRGNVVIRDTGPWTPTVHILLRHLEDVGFDAAPRLVGSGFAPDGRETLTFIDGEFTEPGPWSLDGAAALGGMLKKLHRATSSLRAPQDAIWFPWHGRDLGDRVKVIGHCDVAPWNIVARDGLPVALIDWETAGPVDPLIELAQMAWLNAKLHDDIVAELEGLPPVAERARQAAAIVDAYGLTAHQRQGFFDRIVEFAVADTAWEADDAGVTPEMTSHPIALWAMAWRARSAAWLLRNRTTIEAALTRPA